MEKRKKEERKKGGGGRGDLPDAFENLCKGGRVWKSLQNEAEISCGCFQVTERKN